MIDDGLPVVAQALVNALNLETILRLQLPQDFG
jgi:hypothetical protein